MKLNKLLTFFVLYTLLSLFLQTFIPVVKAQSEPEKGEITLEPNITPFLKIHFDEEFFRFRWKEHRLDIKLLIVYNTSKGIKHFSLKDFWRDTLKPEGVKRNVVIEQVTDAMYEFGLEISDIPLFVANNVEYIYWKFEDATFNYSEVEMEKIEVPEETYNITRLHLPSNLVLSYEDLWKYNYTVSYPNVTYTIVEGIKGKTEWYLDPITFSGNIISISGYSSSSPSNCSEIYKADKGGTLELMANTTAGNHTLTVQVRPADNKSIPVE